MSEMTLGARILRLPAPLRDLVIEMAWADTTCPVARRQLAALVPLRKRQYLSLAGHLSKAAVAESMGVQLKRVGRRHWEPVRVAAIRKLATMAQLRSLDLLGLRLRKEARHALAEALPRLVNLQHLDMRMTMYCKERRILNFVARLPALRELAISRCCWGHLEAHPASLRVLIVAGEDRDCWGRWHPPEHPPELPLKLEHLHGYSPPVSWLEKSCSLRTLTCFLNSEQIEVLARRHKNLSFVSVPAEFYVPLGTLLPLATLDHLEAVETVNPQGVSFELLDKLSHLQTKVRNEAEAGALLDAAHEGQCELSLCSFVRLASLFAEHVQRGGRLKCLLLWYSHHFGDNSERFREISRKVGLMAEQAWQLEEFHVEMRASSFDHLSDDASTTVLSALTRPLSHPSCRLRKLSLRFHTRRQCISPAATSAEVAFATALGTNTSLRSLEVELGTEAIPALVEALGRNKTLRELGLDSAPCTGFVEAIPSFSLRWLSLSCRWGVHINDECLERALRASTLLCFHSNASNSSRAVANRILPQRHPETRKLSKDAQAVHRLGFDGYRSVTELADLSLRKIKYLYYR